jgi:hypothetical protein
MPKFSQSDWNKDNAQRLSVIIMVKLGRHPLTAFRDLQPSQKLKFNRLLNDYILASGDNWNDKLLAEFNTIVTEDVLNENYNPEKTYVPIVNTTPELLLSPEQIRWAEERQTAKDLENNQAAI